MFPNASYIAHYFFGTPVDNSLSIIQTFGLFLIITFFVGYYVFKHELRWREKAGIIQGVKLLGSTQNKIPTSILIANFFIGFFVGFKLPILINRSTSASLSDLIFSGNGSLKGGIIGAILLGGMGLYIHLTQKEDEQRKEDELRFPSHFAIELTIISAIAGIVGSKMFSIFENLPAFYKDPIGVMFSGSGLTIYGGLITAFIVGFIYMKRKGFKVLGIMDALGPTLLIGYMIGRLGCHFSGDGDWGIINNIDKPSWLKIPDWLWSYRYPHNVVNSPIESIPLENCGGLTTATGNPPIYCRILAEGVFPTPLYEVLLCGLILVAIYYISRKNKITGIVFFSYLALSGIERFLIEFIRVNERYDLLGLGWSFSQWIAMGMVIAGIVGVYFLRKNTSK